MKYSRREKQRDIEEVEKNREVFKGGGLAARIENKEINEEFFIALGEKKKKTHAHRFFLKDFGKEL